MQMAEITNYFKGIKKSGSGYTALCPAHQDKQNSLSIGTGQDGKILLHCHAGCTIENIVAAAGLKMSDLCPDSGKIERQVEAVYQYKDLNGKVVHETVRYFPKGFTQRRPDGKGGFIYSLKGVKTILFNLSEIAGAVKEGKTIYLCEGEKDCINMGKLGLTATTSPMGAGKWKTSYSDILTNAHVIILPDNDTPGKEHTKKVANSLKGKAASVKVVELPNLQEHGDVTDFFKTHGKQKGLELLQGLVDEAEDLIKPKVKTLSTINAKTLKEKHLPPVIFTIDGLLSAGLSILAAPPKAGKSWLSLWLCLRIAQGLPVWNRRTRQGTVLYLALEDSLNRLQSRLNALTNTTPDNLHFAIESDAIANGLTEQLEGFISKHPDTAFIVIDTLQKVRLLRKSENAYQNDYADAGELKKFADKHGLSLLVVHHTRKMADDDPFNTISGSTGLTGASDSMFVISKQSRTSQEAILHATGRDIDPQELAIRFNDSKTWELVSEDAAAYIEQRTFEENPLFILCKRFLLEQEKFEGTASELHPLLATLIESGERFRFPTSGQALSRELFKMQPQLKEHGILFDRGRSMYKRTVILEKIPSCSDNDTERASNAGNVRIDDLFKMAGF